MIGPSRNGPTAPHLTLGLSIALAAGGFAAPAARKPAPKPAVKATPRRAASPTRRPARTRPIPPAISTSSTVPEYRRAEGALARFITALQTGRRPDAAALFASAVTAEERRTFLAGTWPRKDPSRKDDLHQILFHHDLQIRVRSIYQGMVRLYVLPRRIGSRFQVDRTGRIIRSPEIKGVRAGYVEVVMRKEADAWRVDLHPAGSRASVKS